MGCADDGSVRLGQSWVIGRQGSNTIRLGCGLVQSGDAREAYTDVCRYVGMSKCMNV